VIDSPSEVATDALSSPALKCTALQQNLWVEQAGTLVEPLLARKRFPNLPAGTKTAIWNLATMMKTIGMRKTM
jgi:hypothetical protein